MTGSSWLEILHQGGWCQVGELAIAANVPEGTRPKFAYITMMMVITSLPGAATAAGPVSYFRQVPGAPVPIDSLITMFVFCNCFIRLASLSF